MGFGGRPVPESHCLGSDQSVCAEQLEHGSSHAGSRKGSRSHPAKITRTRAVCSHLRGTLGQALWLDGQTDAAIAVLKENLGREGSGRRETWLKSMRHSAGTKKPPTFFRTFRRRRYGKLRPPPRRFCAPPVEGSRAGLAATPRPSGIRLCPCRGTRANAGVLRACACAGCRAR